MIGVNDCISSVLFPAYGYLLHTSEHPCLLQIDGLS